MAKKIIGAVLIVVIVGIFGYSLYTKLENGNEAVDNSGYPLYVENYRSSDADKAYYNDILLDESSGLRLAMTVTVRDAQVINYGVDVTTKNLSPISLKGANEDSLGYVTDVDNINNYIAKNLKLPTASDVKLEAIDYSSFVECFQGLNIPKGVTIDEYNVRRYKGTL